MERARRHAQSATEEDDLYAWDCDEREDLGEATFGPADAAAATVLLERAWAVVRHDAQLIEAGAIEHMSELHATGLGYLGCPLRDCHVRCDQAAVCQALAHIQRLAAGAWFDCDVVKARAEALVVGRDAVAHTRARPAESAADPIPARAAIYAVWVPYIRALYKLDGHLCTIYGAFWARMARHPSALAGYRPPRRFPTPRAVESWLEAQRPHRPEIRLPWAEVDEGVGAPDLARLRAATVISAMASDVVYPAPGDTLWAVTRRALMATLAADPHLSLTLALDDGICTRNDGVRVSVRTVSVYAERCACPLSPQSTTPRRVVARITLERDRTRQDAPEVVRVGVIATSVFLQRVGIRYTVFDAWLRDVARRNPEALYTTALLESAARRPTPRIRGAPAQQPTGAMFRLSVALDGCALAALVRDARVVQTVASDAAPRLFSMSATPLSSAPQSLLPFPGPPTDAQAAADAKTLLAGGDVPADRVRPAVRYAAWRVCRAGGRDGCDYVRLASFLEQAGLAAPPSIAARLALLWA
ncbi:hypothetical protein pdul_cds_153 [Pandoravirus dulcis]|uniref:Uncharacterized protein n=1 Tax=Pandoravirus dulcis TaxID=1349409 RepID=S4VVV2_9VIRU|nr:hypothetical protein pdul_cds_153 [Pandoravirus dulcis]AGO82074.1 hypothetical protein pdul_cds_153 [Pandoravirus dulcis]